MLDKIICLFFSSKHFIFWWAFLWIEGQILLRDQKLSVCLFFQDTTWVSPRLQLRAVLSTAGEWWVTHLYNPTEQQGENKRDDTINRNGARRFWGIRLLVNICYLSLLSLISAFEWESQNKSSPAGWVNTLSAACVKYELMIYCMGLVCFNTAVQQKSAHTSVHTSMLDLPDEHPVWQWK